MATSSPSPPKKTTKKQQAGENYRRQQAIASASEPTLPHLVAHTGSGEKKKKPKKLKSRLPPRPTDDGSSVESGAPLKSK